MLHRPDHAWRTMGNSQNTKLDRKFSSLPPSVSYSRIFTDSVWLYLPTVHGAGYGHDVRPSFISPHRARGVRISGVHRRLNSSAFVDIWAHLHYYIDSSYVYQSELCYRNGSNQTNAVRKWWRCASGPHSVVAVHQLISTASLRPGLRQPLTLGAPSASLNLQPPKTQSNQWAGGTVADGAQVTSWIGAL